MAQRERGAIHVVVVVLSLLAAASATGKETTLKQPNTNTAAAAAAASAGAGSGGAGPLASVPGGHSANSAAAAASAAAGGHSANSAAAAAAGGARAGGDLSWQDLLHILDIKQPTITEDKEHAPQADWKNNPNALEALVKAKGFQPIDSERLERCRALAASSGSTLPDKSPIGLMSAPYPAQHELRHHFVLVAPPVRLERRAAQLKELHQHPKVRTPVEYVYKPRNCWDVKSYAEDPAAITADSDEYITGCAPYKKHAQRLRQFIDCGNAVFAGITRWDDQRGKFKEAVPEERGKIKLEMEAHATFDDYAEISIENPASYLQRIAFLALTSAGKWGTPDFFRDLFYMDATKPNYAKRLKELADKVDAVNQARVQAGQEEFHPRQPPKRMIPKVDGKEYHVRPVALFGYKHIQDTVYDYEFAYMTEAQESEFEKCFGGPGTTEATALQHAFFMYPTMMGAVGQLTNGLSQHDNYYITGGETPEHLRGEPNSVVPHSQYVVRMNIPAWCARKATELTSNFAVSLYAKTGALVFRGYMKTHGVFNWNAMCAQAHLPGYPFSNCRVFAQCWAKAVQRTCAIDDRCCASQAGHDACKGDKWDSAACRQSLFRVVDETADEDPYPRSNIKGWVPPRARTTTEEKLSVEASARRMHPSSRPPLDLLRDNPWQRSERSHSSHTKPVHITDHDLKRGRSGSGSASAAAAAAAGSQATSAAAPDSRATSAASS